MSQAEGNRGGTPTYDSLEVERHRFKSLQDASSTSHKQAMQQLYKKQLDSLYEQKLKYKQAEKTKQEIERRQFNQQVEQGIQAERNKQVSYKNDDANQYYNMLMNNQSHHQETYVSPFSKRDNLKDALIQKGVDEDLKRYRQSEQEARMRQAQKRNNYKNELMRQIEERRNKEMVDRERAIKQKQDFQRTSKVPKDIQRYQKQRKKDEVEKYRADLDLMSKGINTGDIPRKQSQGSRVMETRPQFHNVLTNPLPYNIQNPYILRQMGQGNNPSYLAMKGSQNLKQLF